MIKAPRTREKRWRSASGAPVVMSAASCGQPRPQQLDRMKRDGLVIHLTHTRIPNLETRHLLGQNSTRVIGGKELAPRGRYRDPLVRVDPSKAKREEHLLEHTSEWCAALIPFGLGQRDLFVVETLDIVLLAISPGLAALEFLQDLEARLQRFGTCGEAFGNVSMGSVRPIAIGEPTPFERI